MKTLSLSILLSSLLLTAGCWAKKPASLQQGEYQCDNCKMPINDLRYKAATHTHDGKFLYFDSIECMNTWVTKNPQQVNKRWVSNYYNPDQWLDAADALVMQGEKVPSPMGGHLVAVATESEWQRLSEEFGGKRVAPADLSSYGTYSPSP